MLGLFGLLIILIEISGLTLETFEVKTPKLLSTITIFRHGDRTPVWIYPKDKYNIASWSVGWGKITKNGMGEAYQLGQFLRARYIEKLKFLNNSFKYEELYVRSTDVDRTLMTAQIVLAALFPPSESTSHEQIWKSNLNWQPIPIHTIPIIDDHLLNAGASCSLFRAMEERLWENDNQAKNINNKFKDFFSLLQEKTGVKPFLLKNLDILADPLISELSHNLSQPSWLSPNVINEVLDLHITKFIMNYKYQKMNVLAASSLLNEISKIFMTKKSELLGINISSVTENLKPKFHMYSGHDTTIASALNFLNAYHLNPNITSPNFCSSLHFELYQSSDNELEPLENGNIVNNLYVKVLYRNYPLIFRPNISDDSQDTGYIARDYNITILKLPDCPNDTCPLNTFLAYVLPKIPKNIIKECKKPLFLSYCESTKTKWTTCFLILPIFSFISLSLVGWGLLLCFCGRRRLKLPQSLYENANNNNSTDLTGERPTSPAIFFEGAFKNPHSTFETEPYGNVEHLEEGGEIGEGTDEKTTLIGHVDNFH